MPVTERRLEEGQQFLSFYFGGEEYATEILRVREVVEYQRLTPVPTTPAWVRGVMNLRGTVVPVLDLAAKLQQGETAVEKLTCIVIFEVDLAGESTLMGVMIDLVGRVLELQEDEIQEPPDFGSPVRIELLEGLGMVEDKPVPILDIQKVLTEDELAAAVAGTEAAQEQKERTDASRKSLAQEGERKAKTEPGPAQGAAEAESPGAGRSTQQRMKRAKGGKTETVEKKAKKAQKAQTGKTRPKKEQPKTRSEKAKTPRRRDERKAEGRKPKMEESSDSPVKPKAVEASDSTEASETPKKRKRSKSKETKKSKSRKSKSPTAKTKKAKTKKAKEAAETKPKAEAEETGTSEKTRQADKAAADRAVTPKGVESERPEEKKAKEDRTEAPREGAPTGPPKKGSSDDAMRSRSRESEGPKGGSDGGAKG